MIKKTIVFGVMLVMCLGLFFGCGNSQNLEWTNDNAVYAFVKAGFESDILEDIEGAFETLDFQKVYVIEKNVNVCTPLVLLFILDEGTSNQQEFIDLLSQDTRINHANKSRDLPFETVDTRYIDKAKDIITTGETLTLEMRGNRSYYYQTFSFEGLLVKPTKNKTYTAANFPVDIKSVETRDNGWLYLELETGGYFEVIKAADILSRLSTIEKVELDRSLLDLSLPVPPTWELSNYTIAEFVEGVLWDDYPKAVIRGLKAGKVTIDFNGVTCEITVV